MHRLLGLALAGILVLAAAGCSSDDPDDGLGSAQSDGESAGGDGAVSGDGSDEGDGGGTSGSSETTQTTEVFNPRTSATVETPFSIPPLDTDEVDILIDEAFEDDVFSEDEIRVVLETAGLDPSTAACEANLLFELGVEAINSGSELLDAVQAMTAEQRARLDECVGG